MKAPSLEQLIKEWEKDAKINIVEPSMEILRIPLIHSKYNTWLSMHKLLAKRARLEFFRERKKKWMYFSGKLSREQLKEYGWEDFPFSKPLKSDFDIWLEADEDLQKVIEKEEYHDECVNFITNVMKEVHNRTWQLKEHMTHERFNGGNL